MIDDLTVTAVDNPYWAALTDHVGPDPYWPERPLCINWLAYPAPVPRRDEFVHRFAWTITDPETVSFVAEHSRGALVDPMAGTGYWAYLLGQAGVDVVAYDIAPPDGTDANPWHKGQQAHTPVLRSDAVDAVTVHSDRVLLLSWPPYDNPIGDKVLAAFHGDRVIYIGEGDGGCCGDDGMFGRLSRDWHQVAEHAPVQWLGMHDWVTVYERVASPAGGAS